MSSRQKLTKQKYMSNFVFILFRVKIVFSFLFKIYLSILHLQRPIMLFLRYDLNIIFESPESNLCFWCFQNIDILYCP